MEAVLDLLPDMEASRLRDTLLSRRELPGRTLEDYLTGFVHKRLGQTALRAAGLSLNRPAASLTQEEIAAEYGSSPATINKWLRELQSVGCVEQQKKGSYHITETGNAVIQKMEKIEQIVAGGAVCKSLD